MPSSKLGTGRIVAILFVGTLAFMVLALVAPWVWQTLHQADSPASVSTAPRDELPWQIERQPDGSSRVFGLTLGRSTLQQAATRWPDETLQFGLVRDAQGGFTLEGYLESLRAGFVQGKMVLTGGADTATLQGWATRATHREPQPSGTWRLTLAPQDRADALAAPLVGLVFLPAARFDEATAIERFGPPPERLTTSDGTLHLLYPEQGVVIAIDPQGRAKPVLQYVAPSDFPRLRAPLVR